METRSHSRGYNPGCAVYRIALLKKIEAIL